MVHQTTNIVLKTSHTQMSFIIAKFSEMDYKILWNSLPKARIDDVQLMCDKRSTTLKKLALKPPRPVQTVTPEPAVPLQPPGGAPHPIFRTRRSYNKQIGSLECGYLLPGVRPYFGSNSFYA
ncbi:hypothetical protein pipiens_001095 [Culex pipiens pipiens]|uniref:Uncharacterized protein n=1 Tax=Culex pipiens pipiens TaxID=38569 RepID=A0ABD1CLB6_CULPP